jgi:hypothetical protein
MQVISLAQSLRNRSPGPSISGAPKGGASHPPLPPQGAEGFVFLVPADMVVPMHCPTSKAGQDRAALARQT